MPCIPQAGYILYYIQCIHWLVITPVLGKSKYLSSEANVKLEYSRVTEIKLAIVIAITYSLKLYTIIYSGYSGVIK